MAKLAAGVAFGLEFIASCQQEKNVEFLISCFPQQRRGDHKSMTDATLIPKVAQKCAIASEWD